MRPLYLQIEQSLRARIASGEMHVGDRLPSENRLAQDFDTTRTTVRQALAKLEFEGLIERLAGLGTFVAKPSVDADLDTTLRQSFEEQVEAKGHRVSFRLLAFAEVPAPERTAVALGLEPGEPVYRLERLRFVDEQLVGLEERYIVAQHARELPAQALHQLSALVLMDLTTAAPLERVTVTVRAAVAGRDTARKLEIVAGAPIMVRDHVFVGRQGYPVLCGAAMYRGDRYQFTYSLGNVGGGLQTAMGTYRQDAAHARSDYR